MILLGDVVHGALIARSAHVGYDPEVDRVISRANPSGNLWGGVIYTGYTGSMVMMHMAGWNGWVTRELTWLCFDYPFNQLGVTKVVGTVRSDNKLTCALDERLGFTLEHEIEHGIPGGTMRIYSMLRDDCRWLKLRPRYLKPNGHAGDHADVHFGPPTLE